MTLSAGEPITITDPAMTRFMMSLDDALDLVLYAFTNATNGDSRARVVPAEPAPGQLVVNATSLGLSPGDPLPLDPHLIDATMTVADVIAHPEHTAFLIEAAARGARTHSGIHMITHQVGLIADHMMELYGP